MTSTDTKKIGCGFTCLLLALLLTLLAPPARAMSDSDCLDCHSDPDMSIKENGKERSLFVDKKVFADSVHAANGCVSCHEEADVPEAPHPFPMKPVNCGNCHDKVAKIFVGSLHGKALAKKDPFAPSCSSCHGKHDILAQDNKKSPIYILNVPSTCGKCHEEGSSMNQAHDIGQKNIIENYAVSIHGEGLYKKGLLVTAVCSSCHTSHNVLPASDPTSTISRGNVSKTCMKCHGNIEATHTKVIRGELWEKEPHKVPACVECHGPHKARRVVYADSLNDSFCLNCHAKPELKKVLEDGSEKSLYVNVDDFQHSIHARKQVTCVKCHVNIRFDQKGQGKSGCSVGPKAKVDCSICHAAQQAMHARSTHGLLVAKNDPNGPTCTICHGQHNILAKSDTDSPTFPRNIPDLCARCHLEGEKAALRYKGTEHDIVKHYKESIHGRGLSESGLMVSASCTNCHTAHSMLPASDPDSSVNRGNITATCGKCHLGVAETFKKSIHSPSVSKSYKKLPVCNDCHTAHTIKRHDSASFRNLILAECGTCHDHETKSYFDTYHGKASLLSGGEKTAKCSDCHGSHNILPAFYKESRLSRDNVVETCRKCHPGSNRKFTGYLTHATHHDREKYPYLFYTFWAMTGLLVGTFAFFGIHTLFWVPRSFRERFRERRHFSHEKIVKK